MAPIAVESSMPSQSHPAPNYPRTKRTDVVVNNEHLALYDALKKLDEVTKQQQLLQERIAHHDGRLSTLETGYAENRQSITELKDREDGYDRAIREMQEYIEMGKQKDDSLEKKITDTGLALEMIATEVNKEKKKLEDHIVTVARHKLRGFTRVVGDLPINDYNGILSLLRKLGHSDPRIEQISLPGGTLRLDREYRGFSKSYILSIRAWLVKKGRAYNNPGAYKVVDEDELADLLTHMGGSEKIVFRDVKTRHPTLVKRVQIGLDATEAEVEEWEKIIADRAFEDAGESVDEGMSNEEILEAIRAFAAGFEKDEDEEEREDEDEEGTFDGMDIDEDLWQASASAVF